ncbi:DUF4054 domain-containing protein [Neorhizobium sp. LjRoot104]|uniref:DUF4054 domain-containing protein n=1 Tax=Neorhizobium sp. LjRoot104 TaxID=3342254 RepID=UPI003ED02FDC
MAYTPPTVEKFKIRYPEFEPVSDALVQMVLDEAIAAVGDTWVDRDRAKAQMLLAAHELAMAGEPARTTSGQNSGATTGAVKRRKVGDVEVEFAGTSGSSGSGGGIASMYGSTTYGQQYLALLRLNFAGAIAV